MKAAFRRNYGGPETLSVKTIETPSPRADEVLVKVHATTVNRTDCAILTGKPRVMRLFVGLTRPTSPVPGSDFAGVVESTGSAVTTFQPGDRIWGFDDNGLASHAEYLCVSVKKPIAHMPEGVGFPDAAASLEAAHYALNFLNKVQLAAGQNVLINGATGGIGSALLQLVKLEGASVTAVVNTKNIELIRSLGADKLIDFEKEKFTTDDGKYDFILDAVGKSTFGECKHLLEPNGIYLSSELGPWLQNPFLALFTPLSNGRKVIFPVPTDIPKSIEVMGNLLREGKFKPVIERRYELEQISEAFSYVASGQKTGNVVVIL